MKVKNVSFAFVVGLIFLVMGAVSANAFNAGVATLKDNSYRVTVGANNQGDVLLGSLYNVMGAYQTKITVINTSETLPVVAKVVFRSPAISAEALDFFIYLTPADVWDGIITLTADGQNAMITSTDDSVLARTGVWASEKDPMVAVFKKDQLSMGGTAVDVNTFGHFEIYGCAAYNAGLTQAQLPLLKQTLYNNYHFLNATTTPTWNTQFGDVPNILCGTVAMSNSQYGEYVKQNLTALKTWENRGLQLSVSTPASLYLSAYNSMGEIDAALAKEEFSIPYDLSTNGDQNLLFIVTFPTKYFARERNFNTGYNGCITILDDIGNLCTYKVWDMAEKRYQGRLSGGVKRMCAEVNFVSLIDLIKPAYDEGFTRGWVKTTYFNGTTTSVDASAAPISYVGVPMLSSYITIAADGDMNWTQAASPESSVVYGVGSGATTVRSNN